MNDSIDKIVTKYFAGITAEEFTYKGKLYSPRRLRVSPLLLRDFECPSNCAACCPVFSLDYLPDERKPYKMKSRQIEFNKRSVCVYSDRQVLNKSTHCRHVDKTNARCKIHGLQPFSCDFELIRFVISTKVQNQMLVRHYGRAWNMLRYDGHRGTLCKILDNKRNPKEAIRKLARLDQWAYHFGIKTKIPSIIKHIETTLFTEPLYL